MRKGKSCGCLIASNVIALEVARRKHVLNLEKLRKRIGASTSKIQASMLRKEEKEVLGRLNEVSRHKRHMKGRFSAYVRVSGYVPPKKNAR